MSSAKIGRFMTPAGHAQFELAYEQGMRALPEPTDRHDVPTAFGRVRVYRFGDTGGVPLVLLHGRNGTSVMWRPNIAALAERRRVFSVDLLGEPGGSVQTAPVRDAGDQAAWLTETLEELGVQAAHLVGMSMGGWAACNYAVRAPRRVASLTLLDPASTFARIPLGAVLRTIPTLLPFTADRALPRFLAYVDGQGKVDVHDPVARVIAAGMRHYRVALPLPQPFSDDRLRSIRVPSLVVIAGRSVMHDPRRAFRRAQDLMPGVRAELWPEATHAVSGQCAEKVNARVLSFVDHLDRDVPAL
jgi:pimeloyl-ACP methyl ester carboxylesterase